MDRRTQDAIIKLYKQGKSIYEVGAEVGVSYVSVWNVLKENDVDMRKRGPVRGIRYIKEDGEFIPARRFPDGTNKPKDVLIFETNAKINIPEGFAVLHLNGKKTDCTLTNLALVTMEYYRYQMGEYPSYYKEKVEEQTQPLNEPRKTSKVNNKVKATKTTKKNKK